MKQRHPLLILGLGWVLFVLTIIAGDCLLKPAPVTVEATPTRVPMTVLPEATPTAQSALLLPMKPTKTPQPPIILDALPMVTSTRVPPTPTPTVEPTRTPEPTPDRPAVQRG